MLQGLQGLFGQLTEDPFLAQIATWMKSIQATAVQRWWMVSRSGIQCSQRCGNPAISACTICNMPTCLTHAGIMADGSVFCTECIMAAIPEDRRPPPRQAQPPKKPPEKNLRQLTDMHLRVLGLKEPSSIEEIKQSFKQLALKYHPDRAQNGKKESATKKFLQVKESYEWLVANYRTVS